jgi:adenylate kinase family enzyme
MIIIFRYELNKGILTTFRELIEEENSNKYNIIDKESINKRISNPITELDKEVKSNMEKGQLITDSKLINFLLQNWSKEAINIIVNFPQNINQLKLLKFHLKEKDDVIDKIIHYKIDDYDIIYDIIQSNYKKFYDSSMRKQTIESMKNHKNKTEKIITILNKLSTIIIDFQDESISLINDKK